MHAIKVLTIVVVVLASAYSIEYHEDKCTSKPNPGACKAFLRRFYYDPKEGKCKVFIFGGCGGNRNRFETKIDCEEACNPDILCRFPLDHGEGDAFFRDYYYDEEKDDCFEFLYYGFKGNTNHFFTRTECLSVCGSKKR
ncbi:BPTI/Kunitz domain-containing protein-like [Styela clava]